MRRLRLIEDAGEKPVARKDGHMKIAFATNDMKRVDAHFGGARSIVIYDVSVQSCQLLEAVQFEGDNISGEDGLPEEHDEDRLTLKIDSLKGCSLLFVLAIGGPAAARVVNTRVHPIKLPEPEAIDAVIGRVQAMLAGNPPPWLRKVLRDESERMDFLSEDA